MLTMSKLLSVAFFSLFLFFNAYLQSDLCVDFVDPMIGTDRMGHTYPGASVPFGMVQLSPATNRVSLFQENGSYNPETYAYCAGYQYRDSLIYGFAHTHFSGTGHSDLGDILLLPVSGTGNRNDKLYSTYTHDSETASSLPKRDRTSIFTTGTNNLSPPS